EPTPTPAVTLAVVATEDSRLNVRSGPGTDFAIVGKLDPGRVETITGSSEDGQWYRVQVDEVDGEAWIAAAYAAVTEATPAATEEPAAALPTPTPTPGQASTPAQPVEVSLLPTPTPTPQPTPTAPVAVIQPERMNVRQGPGTNYPVVTTVTAGTWLPIVALGPQGEWYQVQVAGRDEPAWVYAGLTQGLGPLETLPRLSPEEIPPAPTPTPAPVVQAAALPAAPAPAAPGFFGYGVQAHMLGGGVDAALAATSDLGFNWIKQQVEWRLFQPEPGAIGFGELHGIVNAAGNRGINLLFSV
ncbi:hypothetical protein RY27_11140, partial [Litorilinea aerophila]